MDSNTELLVEIRDLLKQLVGEREVEVQKAIPTIDYGRFKLLENRVADLMRQARRKTDDADDFARILHRLLLFHKLVHEGVSLGDIDNCLRTMPEKSFLHRERFEKGFFKLLTDKKLLNL